MEIIKNILDQITDAWNHYFWEYKFCQNLINFDEEIKTNYYGDILSYFNDTLGLLSNVQYESDFNKSIFQAVGLLQIIYTHQDLIDELLYIFKLPASLKEDKNPNREIRNELIGHPIRRNTKTKQLISSVFFQKEFKNGRIQYSLYTNTNSFPGATHKYELDEILKNHKKYLEKYTSLLWKQIERVLRKFQKTLSELNDLANTNIDFKKIVKLVEFRYNKMMKENYLFEKEVINSCYLRRAEHPRYLNAVNLFIRTLREYLPETIRNIDELFNPTEKFNENYNTPIVITYVKKEVAMADKQKSKDMSYEFSKLFENHPIFGIDFFKTKFRKDKAISEELLNMEIYRNSKLEYYSSYEYLRILLIRKKYLDS